MHRGRQRWARFPSLNGIGAPVSYVEPGQIAEQIPSAPRFRAQFEGKDAEVLFAGMAPSFVGVMQVNLKVPALSQGETLLTISVGGVESNAVPVYVARQ
jgi:hypothetical protein